MRDTPTDVAPVKRSRWIYSLSAKLLLLTIGCVMIVEALVFVPSLSNFRRNWMMERLAAAQVAALAAEVAPNREVPVSIRNELLESAQVHAVALKRDDARQLILQTDMPLAIDEHFDLRQATWLDLIYDALAVYFKPSGRHVRVIGEPSFGAGEFIEIVVAENPLRAAMFKYGRNVLGLSLLISVVTGAFVFFALNALFVGPMQALTRDMVRFSKDPEDKTLIIAPSTRGDEIGIAERELAQMQKQIADMLQQKSRLAALGLAVSKINHDLRNMLTTAQLVSDRLASIKDPTARKLAPKLLASIDRAIRLCSDTLKFGRAQESPPMRARIRLRPLVEELGESLGLAREGQVSFAIKVANDLEVDADRDQLYRVLGNVCRNAHQALESAPVGDQASIAVSARREGAVVVIDISDTGPGVPKKAREHLFEPFQGSERRGGTGLGLAIAAELVRAHGGSIELLDQAGRGATFRIVIPDQVVALNPSLRSA